MFDYFISFAALYSFCLYDLFFYNHVFSFFLSEVV